MRSSLNVSCAISKKAWFSSYEVAVISATKKTRVHSEEGLTNIANKTIYDNLELDVLIVPSAYDIDEFLENPDIINFIKKQNQSTSWIASNCSGAFLLGEAGILVELKATTWAGGEKGLLRSYPKINVQFDKNVVIDRRMITSNGGLVSYQAAFELLAKLSSDKFAKEISKTIQFNRLERAFKP